MINDIESRKVNLNDFAQQPIETWNRITSPTGVTWVCSFDAYRVTMTYQKIKGPGAKIDRLRIVVSRGLEICDTFATWERQSFEDARAIAMGMVEIAMRALASSDTPATLL